MITLEGPDHADVQLVVGLALGFGRLRRLHRLGQRIGAALHLEIHPDLEQLQGRQLPNRLRAGELGEHVKRALKAERRVRLGGDREPDVELVITQIVVRDPGVLVDDVRRAPGVLGIDLGRDQHRGVAERAGVEDRRHLTDDPLLQQMRYPRQHLLLGDLRLFGHVQVGSRRDRKRALHEVEQALVQVVQRDRRPMFAGTEFGAMLTPSAWSGRVGPRGRARA